MPETDTPVQRKRLGKIVSVAIPAAALITGLLVIYETTVYPRTDDAEVFANFIGIAPQVDGPITTLAVQDNAFVKQGGLLFEIDPRPYEYALQRARSDLNTLEGQIVDETRTIASQESAVGAARANTDSAAANVDRAAAAVNEAQANVASAKAELDRAQAELLYTSNNFHRIEPLLAKQFVTVDQVDQARTAVTARQQAVDQARSQVALAEAQVLSARAQYEQAKAAMQQSHAQLAQSQHSVLTLEPLTAQRQGKAANIRTAEYNLNNCRVYAPFDARVTNLTISQGAYAHTGQQVFTLIDTRDLVGGGKLSRNPAPAHQAGDACRCVRALAAQRAIRRHSGQRWLRRAAGLNSGRHVLARTARCATVSQLGASGHAFSGARAHPGAGDGTVSSERIGGRGHATSSLRKDAVGMSAQDQALPAVARSKALDDAGAWFWQFLKTELAPYPGRTWVVGRITIAATITMVLVMTFRIPYGFLGAIYTLFLSRENPTATLRAGIRTAVVYVVATVYTIVGVVTMVDDPLTHFLWIATLALPGVLSDPHHP